MTIEFDVKHMGAKQLNNVGRLLQHAYDIGFSLDHAYIGYNTAYGNTYLYNENYNYTLFISDFDSKIKALYSCPYDGVEVERNAGNDIKRLEQWVQKLTSKSERKEAQ